jgi:hypothetical protein
MPATKAKAKAAAKIGRPKTLVVVEGGPTFYGVMQNGELQQYFMSEEKANDRCDKLNDNAGEDDGEAEVVTLKLVIV